MKIQIEWLNPHTNKYTCPTCGKEYGNKGIASHIWRMHGIGVNHKCGRDTKTITAWNKGLTKYTDNRLKVYSDMAKLDFASGVRVAHFKGKKHSQSTIAKLKEKSGGVRKGAGRGKSGWYKGYWCDSTWELAWVIYHIDHNISFIRNTITFPYEWENEPHEYHPDFRYSDGTFIEVKGYITEHTKAKLNAVKSPNILTVLTKVEIKPYLDYVHSKYNGINLISLYDNTSRYKTKICPICTNSFIPNTTKQVCCGYDCRLINSTLIPHKRKVDRPSMDILIKEIQETNFVLVGKKYGVSDNAIRRWCRYYKVDPKSIKKVLTNH